MKTMLICCACLVFAGAAFAQTPFDRRGELDKSIEPCWILHAEDGETYELKGEVGGFIEGDSVRVIGTFAPQGSFCLTGKCCVTIEWIGPADGQPPGVSTMPRTGLIAIVLTLAAAGAWSVLRRRRIMGGRT